MRDTENDVLNETTKEIEIDEEEQTDDSPDEQTVDANSYRFVSSKIKTSTSNKMDLANCY